MNGIGLDLLDRQGVYIQRLVYVEEKPVNHYSFIYCIFLRSSKRWRVIFCSVILSLEYDVFLDFCDDG